MDASIAAGVERFVQESFALVYPDSGDQWIDETVPLHPVAVNRSILDAERSAAFRGERALGRRPPLRRVLRPGRLSRAVFIDSVKKGRMPVPGRPEAFVSSVSHDDAATAVVAALARVAGARAPDPLPPWVVLLMGSLGEFLGRSLRISNRRLREASAWKPRYPSLHEGWPATVREMLAAPGRSPGPPDAGR